MTTLEDPMDTILSQEGPTLHHSESINAPHFDDESDVEVSTNMMDYFLDQFIFTSMNKETLHLTSIFMLLEKRDLIKVQEVIMASGVDINKGFLGLSILQQCVRGGYDEGVQLMLSFGVDVNLAVNIQNMLISPLMIAIFFSQLKIMSTLIANGANVNYQEPYEGVTPLIVACSKQNISAVELLLLNYANPLIKNHAKATALEIAELKGDRKIVKLLKQAMKQFWS